MISSNQTPPAELGYRMPAEWYPHAATWLALQLVARTELLAEASTWMDNIAGQRLLRTRQCQLPLRQTTEHDEASSGASVRM